MRTQEVERVFLEATESLTTVECARLAGMLLNFIVINEDTFGAFYRRLDDEDRVALRKRLRDAG